jgi:hypothetical protein
MRLEVRADAICSATAVDLCLSAAVEAHRLISVGGGGARFSAERQRRRGLLSPDSNFTLSFQYIFTLLLE